MLALFYLGGVNGLIFKTGGGWLLVHIVEKSKGSWLQAQLDPGAQSCHHESVSLFGSFFIVLSSVSDRLSLGHFKCPSEALDLCSVDFGPQRKEQQFQRRF